MIRFERVSNQHTKYEVYDVTMPKRQTKSAVAYDFYSPIDIDINPKSSELIWTNIKATFPENVGLVLCVRSGMGNKNITLANAIGVIESDYFSNQSNDGNLGFRLHNYGNDVYQIKKGDRIGQGFFINYLTVTDEETPTKVRTGGFGSTGQKWFF